MIVKRNVPLTSQVAALLRQRLRLQYSEGGQIPGELELTEELDVSRGTIRHALAILEREGVIYRKQGSGTFANKHVLRIDVRAEHAYEFTDLIRRSGYEAGITLVNTTREAASEKVGERLNIELGNEVVVVRKVFLADDEPAILCTDMFPARAIREPYEESEFHVPIFNFLKRHCHQEISYNVAEIMPALAGEKVAELLGCAASDVVLRFDEISYDQDNHPALFSRIYYRADRIHFSVLRKKL